MRRRRAQQEDCPWRRLLDRLQQGVRRRLGEPVRILDQHDLPRTCHRPARRKRNDRSYLVGRDEQPLRYDGAHIGMGARQHRAAVHTLATTAVRTLQRCRERARRDRPAGTGRAGEEPRVRHRCGRHACVPVAGRDRGPQHLDGIRLADDVGEDSPSRQEGHLAGSGRARPMATRESSRPRLLRVKGEVIISLTTRPARAASSRRVAGE